MKSHLWAVVSWCLVVLIPAIAADPATEWLAAHSVAGVHVNVGELSKTKAGQQFKSALARFDAEERDGLRQVVGLPMQEIDRVAIVLVDIGPRVEDGFVVQVRTAAPLDRARLLKNLGAGNDRGQAHAGKSVFELPNQAHLLIGSDRSYSIVYSSGAAELLLDRLLSNAPAKAAQGVSDQLERHTVVVWVEGRRLPKEIFEELPSGLQPLRDVQRLLITGDVKEDQAQFSCQLQFARNGLAADGLRALEEGRPLASDALATLEKDLRSDDKSGAAAIAFVRELQQVAARARFRHSNTDVTGNSTMQLGDSLQAALAEGAGFLQMRADRTRSMNNIKQLSLAFHNHESTFAMLPAAAICDAKGKPLLSWRVAVLPFLEQEQLYRQFKLDEAWDSEHNKKLIARMPEVFRLPGDRKKHEVPSTFYQVFVGGNAVFQWTKGGRITEIADGTSNTIWLAEAAEAVPWTKPADIDYDPSRTPKIGHHFGNRCNLGFADGSVRSIRKSLKPEVLHLLIQKNDGQVVPPIDD